MEKREELASSVPAADRARFYAVIEVELGGPVEGFAAWALAGSLTDWIVRCTVNGT